MMEITGMLISGKMSIAIFCSTNGVARTISIAITMKVYGRRSARPTTPPALPMELCCPSGAGAGGDGGDRRTMADAPLRPVLQQGTIVRRPVFAAFDQGQIPDIAVFSQASTPLGLDLDRLIAALQTFVTAYVAPVWGTPARLARSTGFKKGAWAFVFLDTADQANALAYHELTPDGLPLSKVFVKTISDAGASLTVAASHELVEMLVGPAINLLALGPDT